MSTGQQLWDACNKGNKDEVQRLIERGADVEWKRENGSTPLITSVASGHIDIARLLLDNGANINAKNYAGKTALHRAAFNGNDTAVRLLIEKGADLRAKDHDDCTPLYYVTYYSKQNNHPSTAAILEAAMKGFTEGTQNLRITNDCYRIERCKIQSNQRFRVTFKTLMDRYDGRMKQLGLESWRNTIKASILDYLRAFEESVEPESKVMFKPLSTVEKCLVRYEQMERLSLLELALWKAKICDGTYFQNMEQVREYHILEDNFDAKEYVKIARVQCGSEVIVPIVLSYL